MTTVAAITAAESDTVTLVLPKGMLGAVSGEDQLDAMLRRIGEQLAQAHERGLSFSGVVWRCAAPSGDTEARLETEIANLLSAVHAVHAVARAQALEAVTLHDTGEALALGRG